MRTSIKAKIIIIGGNFAGLQAAMQIPKKRQVLVIDPKEHFEWIPNIHELISGVKTAQGLRLSRLDLLQQAGHQYLQDRVVGLNPQTQTITTESGQNLNYDICVVASGGVNNTFNVEGVQEYACFFRSVNDVIEIEERLKRLQSQQSSLRCVIVGAGVTGIEALGEILRRYRNLAGLQIHLVEAGPRLLPSVGAQIDADVREHCRDLPVTFHTQVSVKKIEAGQVILANGEVLASDLTIWTAGVKPPQWLSLAGLLRAEGKWAEVKNTLQSQFYENVFIVGDAAEWPGGLGKQAYHALEMGDCAGRNIERLLNQRHLKKFVPAPKPQLIAFGDLDTYLVAGQVILASKYFAAAKEGIYQLYMSKIATQQGATDFGGFVGRLKTGLKELVLPEILSVGDFKKLQECRVLRMVQ